MTGQADSARVGHSLAVAKHYIRLFWQTLKYLNKKRDFTKGEQAWHVGKFSHGLEVNLFLEFEGGKGVYGYRRHSHIISTAIAHVGAGHQFDIPGQWLDYHS
jgi:hypothetical protein